MSKGKEAIKKMKWYNRALSGILAASLSAGCLAGLPHAAALDQTGAARESVSISNATGDIQAKIRLDYPISNEKLQNSNLKVTLLQGEKTIAHGSLGTNGVLEFTDGGTAKGTITQYTENQNAPYIDVLIQGLSAEENKNQYQLKFDGDGFKTFESDFITLDKYSKGIVLGTGDGTFTQGDLNGDQKVDQDDIAQVKEKLGTNDAQADLNGDGTVDISDLAAITMASGATGQAQLYTTTAIMTKVIDTAAVTQEITQDGKVEITSGAVENLFSDDGQRVTLKATEAGATEIALPIPLAVSDDEDGVEMEQVEIVSSTGNPVEKGTIIAETADGQILEIPFDESAPEGVYAIQTLDDGRKVVTISLGQRVPVKKITIKVEIQDDQEIVVEQIKFLQDIVPEHPASENVQVQNVKAQAGAKQVTLTWDAFPNITGYKIYYGTSASQMTNTATTENTTYTVEGLENLKTYYFAVAPISEAGGQTWEGGKSAVVSAVPQPNSVPDKPDNVTLTEGDGLLIVRWKPGKDTQHSRVQYRVQGTENWTLLENTFQTSATIPGLENDVTYEVQVFGVNAKGNGPVSLTAEGTPKADKLEGPKLPTKNRLDHSIIQSVDVPWGNTDYTFSKGSLPGSVYDGDYSTGWIAKAWYNSRAFTFHFDQAYEMDYMIYVPNLGTDVQNQSGKRFRDYFTAFSIWINGEQIPDALVSYEAAKDNEYFIVKFPRSSVSSITVQGKQWDGAGNITLSEVAFYEYDGLADEISALFSNDSHTALAQGVDASRISSLRAKASSADAYYVDRAVLLDELNNAQQLLEGRADELLVRTNFASRNASADSAYGQSASALQPLGVSALSNQYISVYVEGLAEGDSLKLVQWQQYSEAGTEAKRYTLANGRNRIYLNQIGNSGSGERGGALYLEYTGANAERIKLQVRDTSANGSVVTKIPLLDLQAGQWYGKSESERKALIRAYVEELQQYVPTLSFSNETSRKTNTRNFTEVSTPSVLLSIPADQALAGLGGAQASVGDMTNQLYDAICAWEQLVFLANKTQGIISADTAFDSYQYPMQTRQNIRLSRMFSGAFMFAAGSYVGIDYNETRAMVTGYPLEKSGSGTGIDGDDHNGLYGWGIAHEIGHNMDKIGYAEITNNIYSLIAQTADDGDMTGASRLEGMYEAIFSKVALGKPGQAGDVFTQLGMYWQLHLAYDEDGSPLEGAGALDFYNAFFTKWKAGEYSGVSKDERIALIASEVAKRNLTEFFTRWGMELSEDTKAALQDYPTEDREIWYLNDQSRRDRLDGARKASLTASLEAEVVSDNEVELTITVSQDADRVQGYEILRNGVPVDFLIADGSTSQTYTDTVGAANNMAFTYTVRVIDKLGYEADTAEAEDVRISYDKTVDASLYDIVRDEENGNILITAKGDTVLTVGGLKIEGDAVPKSGAFMVLVSSEKVDLPTVEEPESIPATELNPAQPIVPDEEEKQETEEQVPEDTVLPEEDEQPGQSEGEEPETDGSEETSEDTDISNSNEAEESEENAEDNLLEETAEAIGQVMPEMAAMRMFVMDTLSDAIEEAVEEEEDTAEEQPVSRPSDRTESTASSRVDLGNVEILGDWVLAKSGRFTQNESQKENTFLTYFNKPDAEPEDTRIWMYDAKQIAISGIPTDVDLADISLLSYPGDNIAFTEGASIGVLAEDYTYSVEGGKTETIEAGTVVVTGSYRGDPLYNSIRVRAKVQTMKPGSSDAPQVTERTLSGETLLFAEIPEDGEVSTISDGFFLFIPEDQEAFKQVNEDHGDNHEAGNAVMIALKAQMWRAVDVNGSDPRMTSDTVFISVPRYDSMPGIALEE